MWTFLVLTLTLALRLSEANSDTVGEEKLIIARAKLLVSIEQTPVKWKMKSTHNIQKTSEEIVCMVMDRSCAVMAVYFLL